MKKLLGESQCVCACAHMYKLTAFG